MEYEEQWTTFSQTAQKGVDSSNKIFPRQWHRVTEMIILRVMISARATGASDQKPSTHVSCIGYIDSIMRSPCNGPVTLFSLFFLTLPLNEAVSKFCDDLVIVFPVFKIDLRSRRRSQAQYDFQNLQASDLVLTAHQVAFFSGA